MLALEAWTMGLEPWVLTETPHEPAALVTQRAVLGSIRSSADIQNFIKNVDLVTFESELIPGKILSEVDWKNVIVFPSVANIRILQDREQQKAWLNQHRIPTARHFLVTTYSDLQRVVREFHFQAVLKKCFGGYDGYGTWKIQKEQDLEELKPLFEKKESYILEEWIPFQRELAIVLARNTLGDVVHLPLVETHQKDHRCDWVQGPAKNAQLEKFLKSARKALKDLNYVGVIAFELFETQKKQLLVNEVAPRVHNSAHYSMDALELSQFALHLHAGLGFAFEKPKLLAKAFVMVNLIGKRDPILLPQKLSGTLHWYHKAVQKPGRKLGHLNLIGENLKTLLRKGLQQRDRL